jgi:hypothetical protein
MGRQAGRLAGIWAGCLVLAFILMMAGSIMDAGGRTALGVLLFLLASVCIAGALILTWHWRGDREDG